MHRYLLNYDSKKAHKFDPGHLFMWIIETRSVRNARDHFQDFKKVTSTSISQCVLTVSKCVLSEFVSKGISKKLN